MSSVVVGIVGYVYRQGVVCEKEKYSLLRICVVQSIRLHISTNLIHNRVYGDVT